jgi:hypothetical protein
MLKGIKVRVEAAHARRAPAAPIPA